jgi:hypothetical protein
MRHILIPAVGDLRQIAIYILSLNVAKGKDIVAHCREFSLCATGRKADRRLLGRSSRLLEISVLSSLVYKKGEWSVDPASPLIGFE